MPAELDVPVQFMIRWIFQLILTLLSGPFDHSFWVCVIAGNGMGFTKVKSAAEIYIKTFYQIDGV